MIAKTPGENADDYKTAIRDSIEYDEDSLERSPPCSCLCPVQLSKEHNDQSKCAFKPKCHYVTKETHHPFVRVVTQN